MSFDQKPRVVVDILSPHESVFRVKSKRLQLFKPTRRVIRIPFTIISKLFVVSFAMLSLVLGHVAAPTTQTFAADTSSAEERAALEAQLRDLESQIGGYQEQITSYQKQGGTLKGQINILNAKIAKLNLEIKSVTLTLTELGQQISDTQTKIQSTEVTIAQNKVHLGSLLKNLYQNEQVSMVEVFLASDHFSDFFGDVNNLTLLEDGLRAQTRQIIDLRNELQNKKDDLASQQADAVTLKQYQESQKGETEGLKTEKNTLLAVTKGQESKYQTLLTQTKATAAQIRNRIFELLGGGELSFEAAYQFAKIAGDATGVRPAFILAILDRESALGQNVGKCTYLKAMNPKPKRQADGSMKSDVDIFLDILARLSLQNPESILVSCANADGAYGGAMGPAQFIPSTWELFKDSISRITGHTPASPWNNADAFTAAGLYLQNVGGTKNERTAAAKYYCGGNWNRYVCTNVYARKVIDQAASFQNDIDTIIN